MAAAARGDIVSYHRIADSPTSATLALLSKDRCRKVAISYRIAVSPIFLGDSGALDTATAIIIVPVLLAFRLFFCNDS